MLFLLYGILGLIGLILLSRRDPSLFRLNLSRGLLSFREQMRGFFTSVAMVVAVLVLIILTMQGLYFVIG